VRDIENPEALEVTEEEDVEEDNFLFV